MAIFSHTRFQVILERSSLGCDELAALIGKPSSTIRRFERGEIRPSLQMLGALAVNLRCSVADFYDEDDPDLVAHDDPRPSELGKDIDDWVRQTLATAPPLTDAQAHRISMIMFGPGVVLDRD